MLQHINWFLFPITQNVVSMTFSYNLFPFLAVEWCDKKRLIVYMLADIIHLW